MTEEKFAESQVKEEVKMNDKKDKGTGKAMARKGLKVEWMSSILASESYPAIEDINHCQGFGFNCVNEPVSKF